MAEVAAKRRKLDSDNDTGADATQVTPVTLREPAEFAERLFKLVTVDGDVFPRFPVRKAPEEHIRSIRTMAMREDDVIVAAFPKAGTHWVWEMVQMLVAGKAEHDSRSKENAMIEFNETADMDFIPSPRVLNSHLFLRQLSSEIVEKRSRVVHVIRNPKDVVVSFYFHMKQLRIFQDNGFEDFALKFLNSTDFQGTCLDYFSYVHEMMRWQTEHPEVPLINIYYEDVKKSPVQSVQTLARFLQLGHATDALCSDIADACAFNNMQEAEISIKSPDRPGRVLFTDLKPRLFRKGEVGDWKNYFTMALSEQYDEVIEEKLKDYNLRFQYSI